MKVQCVVAVTRDGVIGRDGVLPWRISDDLKRFKRLTVGQTVIMGRNTYESIGRALPERHNIVLDREGVSIDGVTVCRSIPEAVERARSFGTEIFVIGGASVYEQMLPLVDVLHISHVGKDYEGTIRFPAVDMSEWREVDSEEYDEFTAKTYERVREYERATTV